MSIQYFLPQRLSSWCMRKLTRIRTPWFKNLFIKVFSKLYDINWQESAVKNPEEFKTFNEFFTRSLEKGARPIADAPLVSPADGKIAACGNLEDTQFIRAKGHDFTVESLIADPELAQTFKDGSFATVYLSPRDYHRVHMPAAGTLLRTIHIPGKLYSVSLKTAGQIPTLFAENERYVSVFDTEYGKMIVILVGAINVSSMETVWAGEITPPYGKVLAYQNYEDGMTLEKGAEMGRFNMGSTAIVLLEKNDRVALNPELKEAAPVQMGGALYNLCNLSQD
ncbi:archaetidylserine decarboxylase [Wohlfahrtiimonas chitiniclastica]|uniref:archaetidylserine decarboxylase n=1 Tax=Wohlfahrtiimonas chitiniclastica TaxID=400946 RepID=UPI0007B407EA|nr:archaetidylserine decarboxylase [Wohlfahrtiimonas chitiniclastica]MBS7827813.1 phosphatidylserine decarboxylase [Wohlfahrtiimonas chitiniclastica]MBS7833643.1 phosphatidylserine decarboxylase [Wohlfahrtiimonas chitiniclastica]MDC7251487.1 phosphatidylserine decarboxylase proenzyme [Wohlfahrtiimonas chitiniclastica]OYQ80160.1 phosphatidylserine decarboxylase [Wohlfahrtiimonas chitiniclastica]OYQ90050.1 phosphatidylserine decarboxylase [Wohlfahrtiimonas chitiniclastica]